MKELQFDCVVHLVGGQTVPNYMAIQLCDCAHHVLVSTSKTATQFNRLSQAPLVSSKQLEQVTVDAYDYAAIMMALNSKFSECKEGRFGFNITGGTKPMSAAALDFCRKMNWTPFYIDTDNRTVYRFDAPYAKIDMPPVFSKVSEFIELAGYSISEGGMTNVELPIHRRALLRSMWSVRERITGVRVDFSRAQKRSEWKAGDSFERLYKSGVEKLEDISQRASKDAMLIQNWKVEFPDVCREGACFGGGVWLEEWVLSKLGDSKNASRFIDLRSGVKIRIGAESDVDAQELDVAFTDGYGLWMLECKSGQVTQEHIQKLENLRSSIGGVMGHAMICAAMKPRSEIIRERIGFGDIALVADSAIEQLPATIESVRAGGFYTRNEDFRKVH
jgi:hypothetical protein